MSVLGMPRVVVETVAVLMLALSACMGGCIPREAQLAVDLNMFDEAAAHRTDGDGGHEPKGMRYATRAPASLAVASIRSDLSSSGDEQRTFELVAPKDEERIARLLADAGLGAATTDTLLLGRRCEPGRGYTPERLIECAAEARAQWLFVYTISSGTDTDYWFGPLVLLTIGVAPNAVSSANVEGFGAVIDVPIGRIIDRWSVTEECWQPANAWNAGTARRQSRERAERRVVARLFEGLGATVARIEPGKGSPARQTTWGE